MSRKDELIELYEMHYGLLRDRPFESEDEMKACIHVLCRMGKNDSVS